MNAVGKGCSVSVEGNVLLLIEGESDGTLPL